MSDKSNFSLVDKFNGKLVVVMHIENPSLFFCRFEEDNYRYEELNCLIKQQINRKSFWKFNLLKEDSQNITLLVYSAIHGQWCRGRLITLKIDYKNNKPACAKVSLLNFIKKN